MKIQIRQGCFETNSSSTHAICINTAEELHVDPEVLLAAIGSGEYGWEVEQYYSPQDKLDYLWQAIIETEGHQKYHWDPNAEPYGKYVAEPFDLDKALEKVTSMRQTMISWIKESGVEDVVISKPCIKSYMYDSGDEHRFLATNGADSGYIDHATECRNMVETIMSDKNIFLHYLFGEHSCICTGNDNGGDINYPDKSTYDLELHKSN